MSNSIRTPRAPASLRIITTTFMLTLPAVLPCKTRAAPSWWDGFVGNGLTGTVHDFAVFEGDVIVGGTFLAEDSSVFNVARWTGTAWEPIGAEIFPTESWFSYVYAVATYQGELYAAGTFNYVDTIWDFQGSIARWNGSDWVAVGPGVRGDEGAGGLAHAAYVRDLAVHNGLLVAVGTFVESGPAGGTNGVTAWNGTAFQNIGAPFQAYYNIEGELPNLYASIIHETDLVIGGFASPPTARWVVETSWTDLGCIDPGGILAFGVWNDSLVAGLEFEAWDCNENDPMYDQGDLARWHPTDSWGPLAAPSIPSGHPFALESFQGTLIAGGSFTDIGGSGVAYIASWDGTSWTPLGSGVNGTVRALLVQDGYLWVGGSFQTAGGFDSKGVARWGENVVAVPNFGNAPTRDILKVAPNPTRGATRFTVTARGGGFVDVRIFDASGRQVATVVDDAPTVAERVLVWTGRDASGNLLAPGVYFAVAQTREWTTAKRFVIVGTPRGN